VIIIGTNFAIIIYYFAYYPYKKYHNNKDYQTFEDKIPDSPEREIDFNIIRTGGEIYTDVFRLFGRYLMVFLRWSVVLSVPYFLCILYFPAQDLKDIVYDLPYFGNAFMSSIYVSIYKVTSLFNYVSTPMLYAINSLFFAIVATVIIFHFFKKIKAPDDVDPKKLNLGEFLIRHLYKVAIFSYAYQLIFYLPTAFGLFSLILVLPAFLVFTFISIYENCNPIVAIGNGSKMILSNYGLMVGYSIMILLINFVMLLLLNSEIVKYLFETILSGFEIQDATYTTIILGINVIMTFVSIGTLLSSVIYAAALFYFSSDEQLNASSLRYRVSQLGTNKKAYGLPTED